MNVIGMDETRAWLEAQGFRIAEDMLRARENCATWYAYRRSALKSAECETNDGKPMQIVVRPHSYDWPGGRSRSVEIDVTGEAVGVWYNLRAYSVSEDVLRGHLPQIERSLIAAWNALHRPETQQ